VLALYWCDEKILSFLNNQIWRINCGSIEVECKKVGDTILTTLSGCGEKLFAPLIEKGDKIYLAEEDLSWVNKVLKGNTDIFEGSCNNLGNIAKIRPSSVGGRSITYEITTSKGSKYLMKMMKRLENDNVEDKVINYLSSLRLDFVPKYLCSIEYGGYLYGMVTSYFEGTPAATFYINSAMEYMRGREGKKIGSVIGEKLALLHEALYNCKEDFCKKEIVTNTTIEKWISRIAWRERFLKKRAEGLGPEEKNIVYEALDSMEELKEISKGVIKNLIGRQLMRIHGDLHLYQIIVNGQEMYFIDFEGEPYKYPASKLEKETPERDIASLIRSIDYTAIMALQLINGLSLKDSISLIDDSILRWEHRSSNEIITSYLNSIKEELKEQLENFTIALAFWVFERATYEVIYETMAKTGYHLIPMNALIRMKEGKCPFIKQLL